jgi:hypothetical protein
MTGETLTLGHVRLHGLFARSVTSVYFDPSCKILTAISQLYQIVNPELPAWAGLMIRPRSFPCRNFTFRSTGKDVAAI